MSAHQTFITAWNPQKWPRFWIVCDCGWGATADRQLEAIALSDEHKREARTRDSA